MKNVLLTLAIILSTFTYSFAQEAATGEQQTVNSEQISELSKKLLTYQDEITVDFLRSHLKVFAHDTMRGRGTGTPALEKAARYLADQYRQMGLQPAGVNNTYFQPFKLAANVTDNITFVTYKETKEGREVISRSVSSKNSTADYVRSFWGGDTLNAPVVFAGFGVVDSTNNVNHLADVKL